MYNDNHGKIRVVGFGNEDGECHVTAVYFGKSSINLYPYGFTKFDVEEMKTLLEKDGVEFSEEHKARQSRITKFAEDRPRRFSVEVHDVVSETKVKVVQEIKYYRAQPSQETLSWIRTALDLPASKSTETVPTETTIFEEFEFLAQGNVFALSCLKSMQLGCENSGEICRNFLKAIYPTKPAGKSFQRDNFWARITPWAKLVLLSKSTEYQATKAAFLRLKRLHRKGVHPIAIFVPTPNAMPQPSTWADGHSAHVPSDGK